MERGGVRQFAEAACGLGGLDVGFGVGGMVAGRIRAGAVARGCVIAARVWCVGSTVVSYALGVVYGFGLVAGMAPQMVTAIS